MRQEVAGTIKQKPQVAPLKNEAPTLKGTAQTTTTAPATTAQNTKPTLPVDTAFTEGGWDTEKIDVKDIIIPKILLMHPTSELVKQGNRQIGELIKSTTEEVLARRGDSLDFLIFEKWKSWRIMELRDGRYVWSREEPCTTENEDAPWDFEENGKTMRRDKTMNFYCVLSKEATTFEQTAFPVKLSFTRTSFKAGLKLADFYAKALMDKQAPTRQQFRLTTELVNGDKETYFVFLVEGLGASTDVQKAAALKWKHVVNQARKTNTLKDHEEEATGGNEVPF